MITATVFCSWAGIHDACMTAQRPALVRIRSCDAPGSPRRLSRNRAASARISIGSSVSVGPRSSSSHRSAAWLALICDPSWPSRISPGASTRSRADVHEQAESHPLG